MSWKRAMAAGAKPVKHVSREGARVSDKTNKCAVPGCNKRATQTVNGYQVCGNNAHAAWAALE